MAETTLPIKAGEDIGLVRLARELAIDHFPLETILKTYQLTAEDWERIKASPRFQALLEQEIQAWNGALNTHERTKLKAAAIIEEWLSEGNARLHDSREQLPAKVKLLELLAKIADMGQSTTTGGADSERFSVTINLGADTKLNFDKELTHKVIDVSPPTGET